MALSREDVIQKLFQINAVKFGDFKLKSGIRSPIYFNLRVVISYPKLMREISELLWKAAQKSGCTYSHVCGVPYTALPLSTCIALDHDIPMVIRRKEAKDYGTQQMIEGVFSAGDVCLVVEDIVTSGASVLETAQALGLVNMTVTDAVVLLDRCQGGKERLKSKGISLHSVFKVDEVLNVLLLKGLIDQAMFGIVSTFIASNQFGVDEKPTPPAEKRRLTFLERASLTGNVVAKRLFAIMETKQTNLAFSADVTSSLELLHLADVLGPHICLLKTHIDIVCDFSPDLIAKLQALACKHNFLLFEDRKFADIGNTVLLQYSAGVYKISEWADIINAHALPGHGVLSGLQAGASGRDRACLLIAQMSCAGALTNDAYAKSAVEMATSCPDFVIGFISTSAVCDDPRFIHMTPGVNLTSSGDTLSQQYLTPEEVIGVRGCDVVIVGRGIYESSDPVQTALAYKQAGMEAYRGRLRS